MNTTHLTYVAHSVLPLIAKEVRRSYRTARAGGFTHTSARRLAQSYRDSLIGRYMRTAYPSLLLTHSDSLHEQAYGGYSA